MPIQNITAMTPRMASDCSLLLRAARFACERHAGQRKLRQKRSTIDHCLEVAQLVCEAGLPCDAVAAAILHDTLEKTETAHHELDAQFGQRIRKPRGKTEIECISNGTRPV